MTELVLAIFYCLRPVSYTIYKWPVMGLHFLELFAAISFGLLVILAVANIHRFKTTPIDLFIFIFTLWCFGAFFAYYEVAQLEDLAKFLLPFFTYTILRISIRNRDRYLRLLWWMIVGSMIPTVLTAVLIVLHKGVYVQNYWTGLFRFTGVYPNPHDLGHSMTFLIMLMAIYWVLRISDKSATAMALPAWRKIFMVTLGVVALFCLYKSYVRTAYLGLLVFSFIYLFFYSKKLFVAAIAGMSVAVAVLWSVWALIFIDVVDVYSGKSDVEMVASGRPYIWRHNLEIFSGLTIDRQLAGVGFGNRIGIDSNSFKNDNVWNSHNDYLDVLMQTGVVGFLVFMVIQLLLFKHVLALQGRERWVFLSLFLAVAFMNFASNSYVARFGLGQSFYMVIIFAEAARQKLWASKTEPPVRQLKKGGSPYAYQGPMLKQR